MLTPSEKHPKFSIKEVTGISGPEGQQGCAQETQRQLPGWPLNSQLLRVTRGRRGQRAKEGPNSQQRVLGMCLPTRENQSGILSHSCALWLRLIMLQGTEMAITQVVSEDSQLHRLCLGSPDKPQCCDPAQIKDLHPELWRPSLSFLLLLPLTLACPTQLCSDAHSHI